MANNHQLLQTFNGGIRRRISAGAIIKPRKRGGLEIYGSSSRFVVGFLCNRASVVSVFPCEEGCCVDELWRLDNALRSRFGKTEQRHRGHFTFKRSHWSMHSTWKLWAQALQLAQRH
ncbi:BnaA10g11540D [Brassica napus]|uniref:BnaA10g11540D protein n=1 Tax=Brassica napus TaxID=3708 RepID=A0A078IJX5_BRANA|nr:BnaA10g11540D [Brassica napus]